MPWHSCVRSALKCELIKKHAVPSVMPGASALDGRRLDAVQWLAGETKMTKNLQAVYENGVLRPLEPLHLREQQLVTVTVTDEAPMEPWLDTEYMAGCAQEPDEGVSLEEVRAALAKIPGSLTEDFIAEREDR